MLALLLPFVWWRRRAGELIRNWQLKLTNAYPSLRATPSVDRAQRWLRIYQNCRGSLEWLVVLWVIHAFLPSEVAGLIEVSLAYVTATWLLGGKVVVDLLDAIAAEAPHVFGASSTGELRLRSLNLVRRVVVGFGLVLSVADRLVGAGTVHTWVLKVCWLAAIPIVLYLVRWWRTTIFERLGMRRRKNRLIGWVVRQEQGWRSFVAAAVGGAYLLGLGLGRLARHYFGRLEVTRRMLAYWFRREAGQKSVSAAGGVVELPLGATDRAALDPEQPGQSYVRSVADRQVDEIIARIEAPGGGVFAVVGERGSGKTSILRRIQERTAESLTVTCDRSGYVRLTRELAWLFGVDTPVDTNLLATRIDARAENNALLVDDAQQLVRPIIGGFDDFDRMVALARRANANCSWVLTFDEAIWHTLERA